MFSLTSRCVSLMGPITYRKRRIERRERCGRVEAVQSLNLPSVEARSSPNAMLMYLSLHFSLSTTHVNQLWPIALIYDCLHHQASGCAIKPDLPPWIMHRRVVSALPSRFFFLLYRAQQLRDHYPDATKSLSWSQFHRKKEKKSHDPKALLIFQITYSACNRSSIVFLNEFILRNSRPLNWDELRLNESDRTTIN